MSESSGISYWEIAKKALNYLPKLIRKSSPESGLYGSWHGPLTPTGGSGQIEFRVVLLVFEAPNSRLDAFLVYEGNEQSVTHDEGNITICRGVDQMLANHESNPSNTQWKPMFQNRSHQIFKQRVQEEIPKNGRLPQIYSWECEITRAGRRKKMDARIFVNSSVAFQGSLNKYN